MAGLNSRSRRHGFTLLEMLVALAVAAIMLSLVTLQLMPTEQSQLHEEATRLALLLEGGTQSAQAGGQTLAWSGSGNSYRFWTRNPDGVWTRIENGDSLHPRTLPDAVHIGNVSFDGRLVAPGTLLLLSPALAGKPFRISLLTDHLSEEVRGDGLGRVESGEGAVP